MSIRISTTPHTIPSLAISRLFPSAMYRRPGTQAIQRCFQFSFSDSFHKPIENSAQRKIDLS